VTTTAPGRRTRRVAVAWMTAALALGVTGCGQTSSDGEAPGNAVAVDVAGQVEPRPDADTGDAADQPSAGKAAGKSAAEPSLPPGDPGLDAPAVPAPEAGAASPHASRPARRPVPVSAMLTAETVRMALGGGWASHAGGGDECLRPAAALRARSTSFGSADAGIVVETVATYRDAEAADAAVVELGRTATGCGWTGKGDPRLGSASVAASRPGQAMTAVASEGVLVLLVGNGGVTQDAVRWGSLVDLALGTSCPAAPDGCH
jgi:hypothetical protein